MIDVRLFDDLDEVARDAGGALDRAAQPSLYDRLGWHALNHTHGIGAGRPLVARARDGAAAAWLFLGSERRRAGICGGWYTLSYAPIFAGGDAAMRRALLTAIARALGRRLGMITLAPLAEPARDALAEAFDASGWRVRAEVTSANWVAHVGGQDFAAYWARRPSRLRNTFRRKQRDAALDIALFDRFDADAWREYEAVYAGSWKPEEGSPAFLRALAEQEGAAGSLRLGIARHEGRPVAAQFWIVEHGTATIHKLAYLESEKARSPGTVLCEAMFRHVIGQDRPALIDFGTGDDGYKADWMDEKRPLYRLAMFNRASPAGWIGAARAALSAWRSAA